MKREAHSATFRLFVAIAALSAALSGCDRGAEQSTGGGQRGETPGMQRDSVMARPGAALTNPGPRTPLELAEDAAAAAPAQISSEAQKILADFGKAYSQLQTAQFSGIIFANLKAVGGTNDIRHMFTSSFQSPNKFRHEVENQFVVGSTGDRTYVFNKAANAYLTNEPLQGKTDAESLPRPIVELLQAQNPSLLFTLLKNPVEDLANSFRSIAREPEVTVDGKQYVRLGMVPRRGSQKLTLLLDPQTHLMRQFSVDLNPAAISERATNEFRRTVLTEIIYTNINTQPNFDAQHFAWSPPEGAKDVATLIREQQRDALVGKPAPVFTLQTLDGTNVSLAHLKGNVVVLDFWASWCPPCIEALPHLGRLYEEKMGSDVKIYAVNVQEATSVVRNFIEARNLKVPVLIDPDANIAQQFGVESLPRTVVINKEGIITEAFSGLGPDTFTQLRAAIDAADNGKVPVREKQTGNTK